VYADPLIIFVSCGILALLSLFEVKPSLLIKKLLDKTKRKPTDGGNKDRQTGRSTEKLSEQPGIRLGKLKPG